VLAVFIPVSGWFADRFSARLVFAAAMLVFTVGSIACGLAVNLPMLVAFARPAGLGRGDDDAGGTPGAAARLPARAADHRHDLRQHAGDDRADGWARCWAGP